MAAGAPDQAGCTNLDVVHARARESLFLVKHKRLDKAGVSGFKSSIGRADSTALDQTSPVQRQSVRFAQPGGAAAAADKGLAKRRPLLL